MDINTVIITGATGFIGRALAIKLLKEGKKVYAIDINQNKLKELEYYGNVVIITACFEEYESKFNEINDNIDVFYHFAWQGVSGFEHKNLKIQNNNVQYATVCIELAIKLKCEKFIFIGSSYQYLKDINKIDGKLNNCSIYGRAKETAKILCQTIAHNNIAFNTVLFTNVFGVGDFSKRSTNTFLNKMINNQNIELIEGNNLHDWTYIDDAVMGLLKVSEDGINNKEYYIGNRRLKRFKDILDEVKDIINPRIDLLYGKYNDTSFVDYNKINLNELYEDTGFEIKENFKKNIIETAEWVKKLDMEEA